MPNLNWDSFLNLTGAPTKNFELLCRIIVRRSYARFGAFRARAQQPGVEFHLKLDTLCSLGEPGRWYGWQCRWYDLPSGRPLGSTRRKSIEEAIIKTEKELPGLTDWVLWTRHPLTAGDQEWFYSLATEMNLILWAEDEIEEHLTGEAEIYRRTFFGDLILTEKELSSLHRQSTARVKERWNPELHQVIDAERAVLKRLGRSDVWTELSEVAGRLSEGCTTLESFAGQLPRRLETEIELLAEVAQTFNSSLLSAIDGVEAGDFGILSDVLAERPSVPDGTLAVIPRKLRARRHPAVFSVANLLSDIRSSAKLLDELDSDVNERQVAIIADFGRGKTFLAAQITARQGDAPEGILLHGGDLGGNHSLDDLASQVVIQGRQTSTMESLFAAVDSAGRRTGKRLPIVIDGLNEAEDPRKWKTLLASADETLHSYPHVLLVSTVRPEYIDEVLPPEIHCRVEVDGFSADLVNALDKYFEYYLIDPRDAELPLRLLDHPLTLRLFCQVANPFRERVVGVEALPGSLTGLFDRFLEQSRKRISELSPRARRYVSEDIRWAFQKVGMGLWDNGSRDIPLWDLRSQLGDADRPWAESLVHAMEQEGMLVRGQEGLDLVSAAYDALAGHLIADALLSTKTCIELDNWLTDPITKIALFGGTSERRPLASDVVRSLVGLTPRRHYGMQLWRCIDEPERTYALVAAANLEGQYLEQETVDQLAALLSQLPLNSPFVFERLWVTRGSVSHPLNADFLERVLRPMPVSERDLRWSEWVRRHSKDILADLQILADDWRRNQQRDERDRLLLVWVKWLLTSTVLGLRDLATMVVYWFGRGDPEALFDITLESLSLNDAYITERMLAASYGVVMAHWADPSGAIVRQAIPQFGRNLYERMFAPDAQHSTAHALMQDYALSIIELALRLDPRTLSEEQLARTTRPLKQVESPFVEADSVTDLEFEGVDTAFHMDFENYTLGRLVEGRANYDYDHKDYSDIRRQVRWRVGDIGFSNEEFAEVDGLIGNASWHSRGDRAKVERYGKKYSWIAFFEMYGVRLSRGVLPEWAEHERPSDSDIDPSFPAPPRDWVPEMDDPLNRGPEDVVDWVATGPTPDYESILKLGEIDGEPGPWLLLDGFVEHGQEGDGRLIFTFLRCLLAGPSELLQVFTEYDRRRYPGNMAIPDPITDTDTFSGEIPWSARFAYTLRDETGAACRQIVKAFKTYGRGPREGVPVELPEVKLLWERSLGSSVNQVGSVMMPSPALCERLGLTSRAQQFDLYDSEGAIASIYLIRNQGKTSSQLLYMREDLLSRYAAETDQTIAWLVWGERTPSYAAWERWESRIPQDVYSEYAHIHKRSYVWNGQVPEIHNEFHEESCHDPDGNGTV